MLSWKRFHSRDLVIEPRGIFGVPSNASLLRNTSAWHLKAVFLIVKGAKIEEFLQKLPAADEVTDPNSN